MFVWWRWRRPGIAGGRAENTDLEVEVEVEMEVEVEVEVEMEVRLDLESSGCQGK